MKEKKRKKEKRKVRKKEGKKETRKESKEGRRTKLEFSFAILFTVGRIKETLGVYFTFKSAKGFIYKHFNSLEFSCKKAYYLLTRSNVKLFKEISKDDSVLCSYSTCYNQ